MKQVVLSLSAVVIIGVSVATGARAYQGIGTQEYVNWRINEMTINRAILKQATRGHKAASHSKSSRNSTKHKITHHTTRRRSII